MATSNTSVCNQALGRIGAKRINNYEDDTDTDTNAIQCRLHFVPTRDALLRSNWWRFARARATLSAEVAAPDFEYAYSYPLPADFLRMISVYEDNNTGKDISRYTYYLEGKKLLSDENAMEIRYIKKVTDASMFDPLFVEVFVLKLAMKLIMPLSGDKTMRRELWEELQALTATVRALDKQEQNTLGRGDRNLWNDARLVGAGDPAKSYA